MRILLLTYYFPPDLGAGSFRSQAIVSALKEQLGDGDQLDVICSYPNRYETYESEAEFEERRGKVTIHRIAVPKHRSDMFGQSIAFVRFALGAMAVASKRDYDVVVASSARLMTAALGSLISRYKRIHLYLDIRDIFLDVIEDLMAGPKARLVKNILRKSKDLRCAGHGGLILFQKDSGSTSSENIRTLNILFIQTALMTNSFWMVISVLERISLLIKSQRKQQTCLRSYMQAISVLARACISLFLKWPLCCEAEHALPSLVTEGIKAL